MDVLDDEQDRLFDVTPDGGRFPLVEPRGNEHDELRVVLNWRQELKRLVPTEN